MKKLKILPVLILVLLALALAGCNNGSEKGDLNLPEQIESAEVGIVEEGRYSAAAEVAEYIHTYKHLPPNYITKKEAIDRGWENNKGNLWEVTDEMSIGGDVFLNREKLLPVEDGRSWYECDVNYNGGYRGGERLVYSSDGLIYQTSDHYKTFTEITFP